jgi:predicted Zn-dependent protease
MLAMFAIFLTIDYLRKGTCSVVSSFQLRQEGFYGLPPDSALFRDRLLKESIHELGHTFELSHCDDYQMCDVTFSWR